MNSHGRYTIETVNQVLSVDATGPFNETVINEYQRALISSVDALSPGPWAMLVVLHDESLFTPEAEAELIQVIKWRSSKGMTRVGLYFSNTSGSDILQAQMTRMYESAKVEHAYFDTIEAARNWLEQVSKGG